MSSPDLPAAGASAAGNPAIAGIRTLALVGPAAAGKTSLAEAMLVKTGMIGAPGSLERGTTVSDHDPLERRMQHSLNSSVMHLKHADARIHFIDTPGSADFVGQSLPALEAVETAAIVINAAAGIEPMALRMMQHAAERHLDRIVIVNKIDAPGIDLRIAGADPDAAFGEECFFAGNLPAAGPVRLVADHLLQPRGLADFSSVESCTALVEQVVEVDADFVERHLNDGDVDAEANYRAPLGNRRARPPDPGKLRPRPHGAGEGNWASSTSPRLLPNPTEGNPPDFLRGEGAEAQPM